MVSHYKGCQPCRGLQTQILKIASPNDTPCTSVCMFYPSSGKTYKDTAISTGDLGAAVFALLYLVITSRHDSGGSIGNNGPSNTEMKSFQYVPYELFKGQPLSWTQTANNHSILVDSVTSAIVSSRILTGNQASPDSSGDDDIIYSKAAYDDRSMVSVYINVWHNALNYDDNGRDPTFYESDGHALADRLADEFLLHSGNDKNKCFCMYDTAYRGSIIGLEFSAGMGNGKYQRYLCPSCAEVRF